jgi:hypothetical protein
VDVRCSGCLCANVPFQHATRGMGTFECRMGTLVAHVQDRGRAAGETDGESRLRAGDILEAVDGRPLRAMPDWFVARAHFELDRPIELQVGRGDQHLALPLVITAPAWRTWTRAHFLGVDAFEFVRFILLVLAILLAFSAPQQLSARLAALMFFVGAVAEGYPSSGWAASLRHLPGLFAILICLGTASCLLASVIWLAFFAVLPRPRLTRRWRWALVLRSVVRIRWKIC